MARLLIFALIVVTVVLLWKAFGPQTWGAGSSSRRPASGGRFGSRLGRGGSQSGAVASAPKGPDDDPDFLWNIKKEKFKQEREATRRREELERQRRLEQQRRPEEPRPGSGGAGEKKNPNDSPEFPNTPEGPQAPEDE